MADVHASDPVDRLLEASWEARSLRANRRELIVEASAGLLFAAVAIPLAIVSMPSHGLDLGLAAAMVGLYALLAAGIRFPLGAGYLVPTYLVLVPMLLLLPPAVVPLLTGLGLLVASTSRWAAGRATPEHVLFSIPNAWHALGPAAVLLIAGDAHHALGRVGIYVVAFLAGCVLDLATSTLREAFAMAVAPKLQLRVVLYVWLIDGCIAPIGLLIAQFARQRPAGLLMVIPVALLLLVLERDRNARIGQAQHRLALVARERTRLQAAVHRLGEAFAAKLDLDALTGIALHGSVDALDAEAGLLVVHDLARPPVRRADGDASRIVALETVAARAVESQRPEQRTCEEVCVLAIPFSSGHGFGTSGVLAVARAGRGFADDEQALMIGLVERAHIAIQEILAHEALREQAVTDPLTGLGNRRKLAADLRSRLECGSQPQDEAIVLMLFDLDGFKTYNDTFGHPAGDALLTRLGHKLSAAVARHGEAYRLGGDEFCALLSAPRDELHALLAAAADALGERGNDFAIHASCGAVLLPDEADSPERAMQLVDERMYAHKQRRPSGARKQARDVLLRIMHARQPTLPDHSTGVATLAAAVGARLNMDAEQLDELTRAAELHDIGKVGIPDAILDKPGELDSEEWAFMRQHTILGERILNAAPALKPVARIVRASHERWDGRGYPDRLVAEEIPLAARIIAVCDAYDAITSDRCYRQARTAANARQELLREAGRQFDPAVVAAFLDEIDGLPVDRATDGAAYRDTLRHHAHEVADRLLQILAERPVTALPAAPESAVA